MATLFTPCSDRYAGYSSDVRYQRDASLDRGWGFAKTNRPWVMLQVGDDGGRGYGKWQLVLRGRDASGKPTRDDL